MLFIIRVTLLLHVKIITSLQRTLKYPLPHVSTYSSNVYEKWRLWFPTRKVDRALSEEVHLIFLFDWFVRLRLKVDVGARRNTKLLCWYRNRMGQLAIRCWNTRDAEENDVVAEKLCLKPRRTIRTEEISNCRKTFNRGLMMIMMTEEDIQMFLLLSAVPVVFGDYLNLPRGFV